MNQFLIYLMGWGGVGEKLLNISGEGTTWGGAGCGGLSSSCVFIGSTLFITQVVYMNDQK